MCPRRDWNQVKRRYESDVRHVPQPDPEPEPEDEEIEPAIDWENQ